MNSTSVRLTDFTTLLIYIICYLLFRGCVYVWLNTEFLASGREVWQVTVTQFYLLNEGINNLPSKCNLCWVGKWYVKMVRNLWPEGGHQQLAILSPGLTCVLQAFWIISTTRFLSSSSKEIISLEKKKWQPERLGIIQQTKIRNKIFRNKKY